MEKRRHEIYLGALMHDIGKLVFRSTDLTAGKGHEEFGEEFIREYLGRINILQDNIEKIVRDSRHHQVPTYCGMADRINAVERTDDTSKLARRYLLPILKEIQIDERTDRGHHGLHFFTPQELSLSAIFPSQDPSVRNHSEWEIDEQESISAHAKLLNSFKSEIDQLTDIKGLEQLGYSLYYLLFKYTARVSSAGYLSKPDISLFDHSRATAGLVNCLTSLIPETELESFATKPPNLDFYFIKGDLAGIQKFIYSDIDLSRTGQSKGLAKKLRGRSVYVTLLTDLIADLFVKEFDLAESNILFSGGGHFTIVLPYHPGSDNKIDNLVKKVNFMLLNRVSAGLSLVTGIVRCDQGLYKDANNILSQANLELNRAKFKKHEDYLEEVFFGDIKDISFKEDTSIGKLVPYAAYLLEIEGNGQIDFKEEEGLIAAFPEFNKYFVVPAGHEKSKGNDYDSIYSFLKTHEKKIRAVRLIKINDTTFLEYAGKLNKAFEFPISYGFRFIGKAAPMDSYGILEFGELASLDYTRTDRTSELSFPQLGILRLDVDNLGGIFGIGLGDSVSFSRIATMSREFNMFFSGYFNELASRYQLYITYSGGDDAFLIGSWYNVLHFAKELYTKFRKFTCENPDITFSAGIFICDNNYPIAKFAEKALDLEEQAKQYIDPKSGKMKNAICVFDHTLPWERYCAMLDFSEKLLSYTETEGVKDKNKLARSLVHRLLRLIKSCIDGRGKVDTAKLYQNVARLHYLLARHGFTDEKITKAQDGIAKDIISLILKDFSKPDLIKDYLIPTHYVVLKTRKTNN